MRNMAIIRVTPRPTTSASRAAPLRASRRMRRIQTLTRHCERSEAIQSRGGTMDCFVASAPRNDGWGSACDKFNTTGKSSLLICRNVSSPRIENISLHNSGNQNYNFAHPGPPEGRFAIVTMRWAGMRWTLWRQAFFNAGRKRQGVRRSRVVLAPRRWR